MAVLLLACLSGCIYDSRWGDAKTAQKNAAQHYSGAQLGASPAAAGPRLAPRHQNLRKLRLITYVTPEHATQVVNWQRRFAEAVERANQVLASSLEIELEIVEGGFWRPESNPDDLSALLVELERAHPAADMEWVIGLVGSLSRLEMSFHRLGAEPLFRDHSDLRPIAELRCQLAMDRGGDYSTIRKECAPLLGQATGFER